MPTPPVCHAPQVMDPMLASGLSLPTLSPALHGLLRDVGNPKGQVHCGKDAHDGLRSFESTNMRQNKWRAAVASKLAGSGS